jgi:hypothetical protein
MIVPLWSLAAGIISLFPFAFSYTTQTSSCLHFVVLTEKKWNSHVLFCLFSNKCTYFHGLCASCRGNTKLQPGHFEQCLLHCGPRTTAVLLIVFIGSRIPRTNRILFSALTLNKQSVVTTTEGVKSTVFDRSWFCYDIGLLCCVCNSIHQQEDFVDMGVAGGGANFAASPGSWVRGAAKWIF